ncbi:hypothetical protein AWB74_02101 [Caballeronia arvi]|uniref:Transcriptional regulator n=1 Tax=Caballeronia arvi TaxID=1777135 RepID=A0A158HSL5_9BURK|nr:hypothetical protein [Caballeronia arvi]SAL47057.1 hypothetical protein AWB74_02101 [Caballeronia arvi]
MKNPLVKPEDIERVLDGGKRLSIVQLMARLGLTYPAVLYKLLPAMRGDGRVQRERESVDGDSSRQQFVYFTGEPPEPVGRPYPAVLMEGTMTGYDKALRQHAALCMATRG